MTSGVDPNLGEVMPEARLEERSRCRVECLSGRTKHVADNLRHATGLPCTCRGASQHAVLLAAFLTLGARDAVRATRALALQHRGKRHRRAHCRIFCGYF